MTMPGPRSAVTVRFARVHLAGEEEGALALDFSETLRRSLVPGQTVTRRDKEWHLANVTTVGGRPNTLSSKVGFVDSRTVADWNPSTKDFVSVNVPDGNVSPFVIDLT